MILITYYDHDNENDFNKNILGSYKGDRRNVTVVTIHTSVYIIYTAKVFFFLFLSQTVFS